MCLFFGCQYEATQTDVNVSAFCPEASPFQPGWRTHTPKSQATSCPTLASLKRAASHLSRLRRTWTNMDTTVRELDGWMDCVFVVVPNFTVLLQSLIHIKLLSYINSIALTPDLHFQKTYVYLLLHLLQFNKQTS